MKRAVAFMLALWLCAVPAAALEPSLSPSPSPKRELPRLTIDNQNVYEGMGRSYSQGYVPAVEEGQALLVLPLLCDTPLRGDCLRVRLGLEAGPFVNKNYDLTVPLTHEPLDCYCVRVPLQLQEYRVNGSYPVQVQAGGLTQEGEEVREDFTLYVTITDGIDPNATPAPEPTPEPVAEPVPALAPKLLVQSYEAVPLEESSPSGVINGGDRLRLRVVLLNTSKTEDAEGLTVTAAAPAEYFNLDSAVNTVFIESLPAGGTAEFCLDYTSKPETPAGQYEIGLSYEFAYGQGQTASGTGTARVDIAQPLRLEFSLLQVPAEAVISDTIELKVQAINLSRAKAYNVRATLEADGLQPSGTAFIGDLGGGTAGEKELPVRVTGLTEGPFPYGQTTGTITYFYQDGAGEEHSESGSFALQVKSPFSDSQPADDDDPGQWWIVMGCIGGALLAFGGAFAVQAFRRRRA